MSSHYMCVLVWDLESSRTVWCESLIRYFLFWWNFFFYGRNSTKDHGFRVERSTGSRFVSLSLFSNLFLYCIFLRMRSTSSDNSIYIPEEILVHILLRLPVKSLARFMCVCKSWSDLIGSSSFIGRHVNSYVKNHNHTFLLGLQCNQGKPKIRPSIFFNETFKARCLDMGGLRLHGSSNGLLCLSSDRPNLNSPVSICNPPIMKYVGLPATNLSCPPKSEYWLFLHLGSTLGSTTIK